jgi:hypothetical protein
MIILRTLLFLLFFSGPGDAGPIEYYCIVKHEQKLSNDGRIEPVEPSLFLGKDFRIHRKTGVVTATAKFSGWDKMRVIFSGSTEHSFIAVAEDVGRYPIASLLEIHEFVSDYWKPFLWNIRGSTLYSGTCN